MIHTMPDSIRRAIRSPFARSVVQTEAPSPKRESLARSIASASSATTITGTTGPKISSLHDPHLVGDAGEHGRRDEAPVVARHLARPAA